LAQTEFVSPRTVLAPSELLFSKVEDGDIQAQLDKLKTQSV